METINKSKEQLIKENNQLRTRIDEFEKSEIEIKKIEHRLKESEEKFRVLYNSSPDMYVSVSPNDASILLCNDTMLNKTGYLREEIIGSPIFRMYHEDCMDDVKKVFQQFVKTGTVKDKELVLKRKDGSKIDVSLNVDAVVDEAGKILYSVSSWRDITERTKAEEELTKHQEHLEEMIKERTKELEEKNKKLDDAILVFVGRELTVRKLEERIIELEGE